MNSVIAWSATGGLVLGAIADALLIGVAVAISAIVPMPTRFGSRVWLIAAAGILVLIPVVGAALGFFEGRLKQT
jgi:hypothetical protein